MHHYSEEDLDQLIDEDSSHDLETIENAIHTSSLSGIRASTLQQHMEAQSNDDDEM